MFSSLQEQLTDKSDDGVGHLNTNFGPNGREYLNDAIFKGANARPLQGGVGKMLKFRVDQHISYSNDRLNCFIIYSNLETT